MSKAISSNQPLVSIGVPAYNGGKYLEECLDSILNQTYTNWECVICNNASTDQTPDIAERYVQADSRFRLFHTDKLLPITENWNFCFSNISEDSSYFKLLPADDWLFPGFLTEMAGLMEKDPDIGICSSYRLVDRVVKSEGLDYYDGNSFSGKEILIGHLKQELNITSSVNAVLYRLDSLKDLSYYPEIFQDESFHQDTYLSYELLMRSKLGFIYQVMSYTRRHDDSVTSTVTSKLNTRLYFKEYALHQFKSIDPSLEPEYRRIRIGYAYFFLKCRLFSRKKPLMWHRTRLARPITFAEYLQAIIRRLMLKKL